MDNICNINTTRKRFGGSGSKAQKYSNRYRENSPKHFPLPLTNAKHNFVYT